MAIRFQEGFQEKFLSSAADIVIGGGAAGAGKTIALLLDPLRYINVPNFGAVIFRRTTPQIRNQGGLWDTSLQLYNQIGGVATDYKLEWRFKKDVNIRFNHLEYEKNKYDHQGGQYNYIGFDELTNFTKSQFLYLLSRNRSTSGVKPQIRATCNPDPDSWVAEFIEWWINQETGYPIPERSGKLRYFINDAGNFVWGDTKQEVIGRCPHLFNNAENLEIQQFNPKDLVKSVTFIPGDIYGNKELLKVNPQYLGNLMALPEEDQLRLLKGNWKIRQDGSSLFNFQKISDLFSNFVEQSTKKYITCDYARFGSNWTIILTWLGMRIIRIEIMTKSSTIDAYNAIENERSRMKIPRSSVAVDEDGVGGGVVDLSNGEYIGFSGGAAVVENPITKIKEAFENFKTQCYYFIANIVNSALMAINSDNIIVDGEPRSDIKIGDNIYDIVKLIKEDLRAIKKKTNKADDKRMINSKDEQKNMLNGRSPDFGDSIMMRAVFELGGDSINAETDIAFF